MLEYWKWSEVVAYAWWHTVAYYWSNWKIFWRSALEFVPLHFQFASGASDLATVSDNSSFLIILESVKLSNVNWTCLDMLIKVLFLVNVVLLEYPLYGSWKSLKSPWIWFWHLCKNHVSWICKYSLYITLPSKLYSAASKLSDWNTST